MTNVKDQEARGQEGTRHSVADEEGAGLDQVLTYNGVKVANAFVDYLVLN